MKKEVSGTIIVLLVMGTLMLGIETQSVKADPLSYIYIRSDGSVYPSGQPITHSGDYYTQTDDIVAKGIVIQRDNITLDGNTYSVTGDDTCIGIGVNVTGRSHVMLNSLQVYEFQQGVKFIGCNYCQLYGSIASHGNISDSEGVGIDLLDSTHVTLFNDSVVSEGRYKPYHRGIGLEDSSYNLILNCTFSSNGDQNDGFGIDLENSNYNIVFGNYAGSNHDGIGLTFDSDYNSITCNRIIGNSAGGTGVELVSSMNNAVARNDVDGNGVNGLVTTSSNTSWDGGYPSYTLGGNYWSDYNGNDSYSGPYQNVSGSDGIGDTAYIIDNNNTDHYPLMQYNYTYRFLTVESDGNGTTDPVPDTYPIPYPGMNMTVTPIASPGYVFDYWLLDGTTYKTDNPITIVMSSDHTLEAYFSVPTGGEGCPYVSAWNGSSYVVDNNILPASETGNGTDVKDYYLLQQPLIPVSSTEQTSLYSLKISEFENEQDYIDQVNLMAVDHSQNTSIAVTPEGEIVTYTNPAAPLSCMDDNGTNRLSEVSSMDGNVSDPSTYYQGYSGNWLVLDFGTVNASNANLILRDDQKCAEVCIDVQVPDLNGSWQTVEVLHPRDFWGMEAVNMTAYVPTSGDFTVRLLWTATHRLDYVGLDTSPQAQITVNSASPLSAVHSTQGDVTAKLLYDDEDCVQLVNGQQITLDFILPNSAQGYVRDFVFYTNGYYYTISP